MKRIIKVIALVSIVGLTYNSVFAATKEKFNRTTTTETSKSTDEKQSAALAYDKGYQAGLNGISANVIVPKAYAAHSKEYTEGYKKGYAEKQAADLAYEKGYQAGKVSNTPKVTVPKAYSANSKEYTEGFKKGYDEKQAAVQTAYNAGYDAGTKGTSATASVPQAYSANAADYTRGYQQGYNDRQGAYDAGFSAGYLAGETESSSVPSSIPGAYSKFTSAYKMGYGSGWATKRQEIIIYKEGYNEGLRGLSETAAVPRDYAGAEWMSNKYTEGYAAGLADYLASPEAAEAAKNAYDAGYSEGLEAGKRNPHVDRNNPEVPGIYSVFKDKYKEAYRTGVAESVVQLGYGDGYAAREGERISRSLYSVEGYYTGYSKGKSDKAAGCKSAYPVNEDLIKYSSMVYVEAGKGSGKKVESGGDGLLDDSYDIAPFFIGKYEVTQEFYESILKRRGNVKVGRPTYTLDAKPSSFGEDTLVSGEVQKNRPVESVTWYDAVYFCNALSQIQGLTPAYAITIKKLDISLDETHILDADVTWNREANGYRLPSEEEWEFAVRGGDPNAKDFTYSFSGASDKSFTFGNKTSRALDKVGWYSYNPSGVTENTQGSKGVPGYCTHEVGKKNANRLGIFDMSGNVAEMVFDLGDGNERILRGGSYATSAASCHVVAWNDQDPSVRSTGIGFRIVRNAE